MKFVTQSLLANHVHKHAAVAMLGAAAILILLQILFTYLGQIGRVDESYGYFDAFKYILTQSPRYMQELLPMAALVGAVVGLGGLASNSELTVMRAAGVSLFRIVFWAVQSALVIALLALALSQFVIPVTNPMGKAIKSPDYISRLGELNGHWQRVDNQVLYVDYANQSGKLRGLKLWQLDDTQSITSITHADSAQYQPAQGVWRLTKATVVELAKHRAAPVDAAPESASHTVPNPKTKDMMKAAAPILPPNQLQHAKKTAFTNLDAKLPLQPEGIYLMTRSAEDLSLTELYSHNRMMTERGTPSAEHRLLFWQKLLSPLAIMSLVVIACSFVFGSLRNQSMGLRLVVALLVGLLFNYIQELFGFMSLAYQLSPVYFVLIPILLSFLIGVLLLRRRR